MVEKGWATPVSENQLREYLIKNIDDRGHFCPVEAHMSQPGIPDYAYTIAGCNGWLELKWGSIAKPPNLRVMQKVWLDRNVRNGGNPLILCGINTGDCVLFGIIHGDKTAKIFNARSSHNWIGAMTAKWYDRIVWDEFMLALVSPSTHRGYEK